MTETERAANLAASRNALPVWFIVALVLSLALNVVIVMWSMSRAQTAETSAVSLAEQVQAACESQGALDLDGRDLCEQADDVAEDPALARVPVDGRDGVDGVDGSDGLDGRDGKPGEDGRDGKDGRPGSDGVNGEPGADGVNGEPGQDGADGTDGQDGAPGADGEDGRGIAAIECHTTGDWIISYTDGTADTVEGPCRAEPAPTPTPTTTKGR